MKNNDMWQAADTNMRGAIMLCSTAQGQSPAFAITLLNECAATFEELLLGKKHMLQQTLGEYLALATGSAKPDAVMRLLTLGAYPDWRTAEGLTPMHLATNAERPNLVKMLAAAGADVNAYYRQGCADSGTAIHMAAERMGIPTIVALAEAGANLDALSRTSCKDTALHWAVARADRFDGSSDNQLKLVTSVVMALTELGADATVRNGSGKLPLLAAIQNGNTSAAVALLDAASYSDEDLLQALAMSIKDNDYELIEALISYGAEILGSLDDPAHGRRTMLEIAESDANSDTVDFVASLSTQRAIQKGLGNPTDAPEHGSKQTKTLSPL